MFDFKDAGAGELHFKRAARPNSERIPKQVIA
jgi:hypothetical protein